MIEPSKEVNLGSCSLARLAAAPFQQRLNEGAVVLGGICANIRLVGAHHRIARVGIDEFAGQCPQTHVVGNLLAHAELLDQTQAQSEIKLGRAIKLTEAAHHRERFQFLRMTLRQRERQRAAER